MPKLVIVESPAKAKTIGKYLGRGYKVTASMGHIRDLPASQLGIDVEHGYAPKYITIKGKTKLVKELNALLEEKVKGKYALLTDEEILELLVNRKWYYSIFEGIKALYVTASHNMANRIIELAERYEYDLPYLTKESELLEAKVKAHLERMGFVW